MSLKYKISLSTILIVTFVTVATLYFLQLTVDERIDQKISEQFERSKRTYKAFQLADEERLGLSADVVTYGSIFKNNVGIGDENTIRFAISESQQQLQTFDLMIVLGANYTVLSSNMEEIKRGQSFEFSKVIQDLYSEQEKDSYLQPMIFAQKLYQTYAVPVENDLGILGYVIIGYNINNTVVNEIKKSIGTDITFFNQKEVIASSLHRHKRFALEAQIKANSTIEVLRDTTKTKTERITLESENYLITSVALNEDKTIYYILATSYDEEVKAFADIKTIILKIGFSAFLIAIIYGFFFGNTIIRPVKKLVWGVKEIEKENYDIKLDTKSRDEIGTLSQAFNEMASGLGERFELLKFVSRNTHEMIKQKGLGKLEFGGERKYMTIFFSDIRGFTSFSEKREPEEVIEMLNLYLKKQAEIVHKYQGDIDKFVGDELMATFEGEDAEMRAVLSAREIQQIIEDLNEDFHTDIHVGIGINSGEVVSGNVGSENRIDHTVLGNHVNLAARLCSKAGPKQIIISQSTFEMVPTKNILVPMEAIEVKGISDPVQIYEVRA